MRELTVGHGGRVQSAARSERERGPEPLSGCTGQGDRGAWRRCRSHRQDDIPGVATVTDDSAMGCQSSLTTGAREARRSTGQRASSRSLGRVGQGAE
jgi:hypothetical protein